MSATIGPATVQCPECGQHITIPITGQLATGTDGVQYLTLEPDMADLWAHAWTHDPQAQA